MAPQSVISDPSPDDLHSSPRLEGVTYLKTLSAGEVHYCEDCGNLTRAAEEHFRSERY
jgi:hypothetical protein